MIKYSSDFWYCVRLGKQIGHLQMQKKQPAFKTVQKKRIMNFTIRVEMKQMVCYALNEYKKSISGATKC